VEFAVSFSGPSRTVRWSIAIDTSTPFPPISAGFYLGHQQSDEFFPNSVKEMNSRFEGDSMRHQNAVAAVPALQSVRIELKNASSAITKNLGPSILDPTPLNGRIVVRSGVLQATLLADAVEQINAKAAQLGDLPGNPTSQVQEIQGGYVRRFEGADIYFSDQTGAHEVHGDIRAKYNALQGPNGVLGLPVTDETGTPDGVGRFNHFVGGSIYWTPNTGPMMVRGAIRDLWASQGWETGPLGYPVMDEYRFRTNSPNTDPVVLWSLFQNGAIVSTPDGPAPAVALAAEVSPDCLRSLVRQQFDQAFHKSPDNIGLQPNVETIAVSDWTGDFWASGPRMITFRLHGFHDNGLAPDTNFSIDAQLRFGLTWPPTFTEPATKTLVVELGNLSVTANGLSSDAVAHGVANGIEAAFQQPISILDIPVGSFPPDFIGLLVTQGGSLQFLMNPLPPDIGQLRQLIANRRISAFCGN
jgi:hypothetical protein